MNMNTSLRVAVVLLLGTTMQGALAAYSPTSPVKIASETGTFTDQNITGTLEFNVPVIENRIIKADVATPPSSQPYYVVITLTGGATFASVANLSLKCDYSADGVNPNLGRVATQDSPKATVGGTVAGFRLAEGRLSGNCVLTFGDPSVKLASGNAKDYGIRVDARHMDTYDGKSATVSGSLITFTQGMQASITKQGEVTVDVSNPSLSKKFLVKGTVSGWANTVVTAVARLGTIAYTAVSEVKTVAVGTSPAANTYLDSFTLTVSGSPLAAVQQSAASGSTSAGIYLSSDLCNTSANATNTNGGALAYASGNQVTFVGVKAGAFNVTNGLSVCMIGNDTSTIDRGVVAFSISSVKPVNSSMVPNLDMVDTTLTKVVKNGTSLKVLNIPSPDAGLDQAALRFYNMGTTPGKVLGTLYGQGDANNVGGGEAMGSNVTLIESLAPNAVKVIPGTEVGRLFGKTTWTGRAWLQIESEIKGLRVQALVRTIVGGQQVLTNMSDRVMLDGETNQRTEE